MALYVHYHVEVGLGSRTYQLGQQLAWLHQICLQRPQHDASVRCQLVDAA